MYLYGVEFLLETDHKPLSCMQTAKVLNNALGHEISTIQIQDCRYPWPG